MFNAMFECWSEKRNKFAVTLELTLSTLSFLYVKLSQARA